MPLAEVIFDFYDKLKSITQGYGSFDYEIIDFSESDLAKLDILVNGEKVDALSISFHQDSARERAVRVSKELKDEIPSSFSRSPFRALSAGKIISRSPSSAF